MNFFRIGGKFSIWDMTERFIGRSTLPEKVLVTTFKETVKKLQGMSAPIPRGVRKRIFPKLAPPYLIRLRSAQITATYNRVLGHYNPKQLKIINEEMDKTGNDINVELRTHLLLRLRDNQNDIAEKVQQKAQELSYQLMLDTIEALRKEGIDIW